MTAESLLFSLLRTVVCEKEGDYSITDLDDPALLEQLYKLASRHDLAHLVGYALEKMELPESASYVKFQKAKQQAIFRYLRLDHEVGRIGRVFEETQIPFIPLKGAVLRDNYPEPWMRTSCDVDVLVPKHLLERAAQALTEQLNYRCEGRGDHDLSLFSPGGIHLDLHYTAVDKERFAKAQGVLGRIWQDAEKTETAGFRKVLTDEMFYFYHIAHMAKHVENGGCGIRTLLDLWILNHRVAFDREKRNQLLREGQLLAFAAAAETLSEIWFSGAETDPMSGRFAEYILHGGTYGILENQIRVYQSKLGGKTGYALRKIFLPYDILKYHYPVLQKYRILTPVFEVVRWLKLLFKGGVRRSIRELQMNANISEMNQTETHEMMCYLDLLK